MLYLYSPYGPYGLYRASVPVQGCTLPFFYQTSPGAHPASCTIGSGSFPGVKSGWGLTLTPYPLLVPWSRKGRAISLIPLWAVRPVQSLSACTRVHFTFLRFNYSILLPSISTKAYDVQLFRIDIM